MRSFSRNFVSDIKSGSNRIRAARRRPNHRRPSCCRFCARAYTRYRLTRRRSGGGDAPHVPLPDFFIGVHAELMGWKLATRDVERYRFYFPAVELIEPAGR